jgi:hypothetical protein
MQRRETLNYENNMLLIDAPSVKNITNKSQILAKLAEIKNSDSFDCKIVSESIDRSTKVIKNSLLPQDTVDRICNSHRQRLEQSFENLHKCGGLKQLSLKRTLPVNPLTVLHNADELVFEQRMKMKEEQLDEWPYFDSEDYLKLLEQIALKYKIRIEDQDSKVDYRLVNKFVASFPNAFLEYKKNSNVTQSLKKNKFIGPKKGERYAKIQAIFKAAAEAE